MIFLLGFEGRLTPFLASCLNSPEAGGLGLLERVRSGPSMLHDSELEWTKNARPGYQYTVVLPPHPEAVQIPRDILFPHAIRSSISSSNPSKPPPFPSIVTSTSIPPPSHPRLQLLNLPFQFHLLNHEPRSRLLQIRNLFRGRGLRSSFDFLHTPEKQLSSARDLPGYAKVGFV